MTKKYLAKKELEETGNRTATIDDCPSCKLHFWSPMHRDSHRLLYPSHFSGEKPFESDKIEAVSVALKPIIKQAKRENK